MVSQAFDVLVIFIDVREAHLVVRLAENRVIDLGVVAQNTCITLLYLYLMRIKR
jgi:hypothetical protein